MQAISAISAAGVGVLLILSAPLCAKDSKPARLRGASDGEENAKSERSWTKTLVDRSKRGTLRDNGQFVRGDSGKWNDEAQVQLAPAIESKPANVTLDDWFDQLREKKFQPTAGNEVWLLFRSRQLNDNDRLWVERIERRDDHFAVSAHEAIWEGRYRKNFTYYQVLAVNLGKLDPGAYEVKWIVQPLVFSRFEQAGPAKDLWPQGERPTEKQPLELPLRLTVTAANDSP